MGDLWDFLEIYGILLGFIICFWNLRDLFGIYEIFWDLWFFLEFKGSFWVSEIFWDLWDFLGFMRFFWDLWDFFGIYKIFLGGFFSKAHEFIWVISISRSILLNWIRSLIIVVDRLFEFLFESTSTYHRIYSFRWETGNYTWRHRPIHPIKSTQ